MVSGANVQDQEVTYQVSTALAPVKTVWFLQAVYRLQGPEQQVAKIPDAEKVDGVGQSALESAMSS